jgi:glutamine amidotransferase
MICILNYGVGNPQSIANMIKHIGGEAKIISSPTEINKATKLILPGVGAFDAAANALKSSGLQERLIERVNTEQLPLLGICVGMQLLAHSSEEGICAGLGLIDGTVKKFSFQGTENLRIPHMGWNKVKQVRGPLFCELDQEARFYFAHSYHVVLNQHEQACAYASYGYDFVCAVQNKNIFGIQFHPEKSHRFGMKLLHNFMDL